MLPKTFYWGAGTSSYQVEGGIETCDWAQAAREGKVPACGRACDHYNRYEEDFDLARKLGHNAHRFSIEWARIEPEEGKFDEREIEHYRSVLMALRARNLEPFVTLWHFTLPTWFAESGGWERKDAPEVFARYCGHVVEKLGELAVHWSTINEPNVFASNGYVRGIWPPFVQFAPISRARIVRPVLENGEVNEEQVLTPFRYFKVRRALMRGHIYAYKVIKKVHPTAQVSIVRDIIVFDSTRNPIHRVRAWVMNWHWTHSLMRMIGGHYDAIGVNYYFYNKAGDRAKYPKSDMHWDLVPRQVTQALQMLQRYKKPLYIAEAGLADHADKQRAWYIRELVAGVEAACAAGVDVRGFMYWSLLDNYEWAAGFGERFGLIEVDYTTLERRIRPSAWEYKDCIERRT